MRCSRCEDNGLVPLPSRVEFVDAGGVVGQREVDLLSGFVHLIHLQENTAPDKLYIRI